AREAGTGAGSSRWCPLLPVGASQPFATLSGCQSSGVTDVLARAKRDAAAPAGAPGDQPTPYGRRATLMTAMAAAAWAAAMGLIVATVVVMASWASSGGTTAASQALRVAS